MEKTTYRDLWSVLFTKYDQIMKNEMGGTCSTYGGEGWCVRGFWLGDLRDRRPRRRWKDNIKTLLQEVGWGLRIGRGGGLL